MSPEDERLQPPPALRILIADDQDFICELLAEYLRGDGHQPVVASDGREALEQFRTQRFDLVITDQSMPGMSGMQLAAAVKDQHPGVPVILLTGFGDETDGRALPTGVDLVLGKPISPSDLRDAIIRVMSRSGNPPG